MKHENDIMLIESSAHLLPLINCASHASSENRRCTNGTHKHRLKYLSIKLMNEQLQSNKTAKQLA